MSKPLPEVRTFRRRTVTVGGGIRTARSIRIPRALRLRYQWRRLARKIGVTLGFAIIFDSG